MDDLQFYILFNSISVISGQSEADNERLLKFEKISPQVGIELGLLQQ